MTSALSVVAEAQNASFIRKIKDTQTPRDNELQVTHRLGGGLCIEGHSCIRVAQIQEICFCHGKSFSINSGGKALKIQCYELIDHLKADTPVIPSTSNPTDIAIALGAHVDGVYKDTRSSGGVILLYLSYTKFTSQIALNFTSHPMVLDVLVFPGYLEVQIIKPSDKRGSLSHLKHMKPHVFTTKWRKPSSRAFTACKKTRRQRPRRRRNSSRFSFLQ